jgi:hypothetical protein
LEIALSLLVASQQAPALGVTGVRVSGEPGVLRRRPWTLVHGGPSPFVGPQAMYRVHDFLLKNNSENP